ncbi:ion channel [Micromonospora sp. NPDC049891]|uniref:potassium channel family protein n=1 Tax=Micromonospora sp. NPDC049891 TaxID=3155655 RepID=UPI0033D4D374
MTVLHPTRRGPVTLVTGVGVWSAIRLLARCVGRPRILSSAGMLAVLTVVAVWTVLMWAGFALLFLPNLTGLSYSPSVSYGSLNFLDALYMSGMSLTTVGFGDVVGGTDALRLITVLEAAAGFGLITAAITYVLSIYPLTSQLSSAGWVSASRRRSTGGVDARTLR